MSEKWDERLTNNQTPVIIDKGKVLQPPIRPKLRNSDSYTSLYEVRATPLADKKICGGIQDTSQGQSYQCSSSHLYSFKAQEECGTATTQKYEWNRPTISAMNCHRRRRKDRKKQQINPIGCKQIIRYS